MSRGLMSLTPILRLFFQQRTVALLLGMALSLITAVAGMALLGLSGWFITITSIAGLSATAAASLNVFTPSAAIRLLAIGRTFARYGERLTTHDATLSVLAAIRERLFVGWATPTAARSLRYQPSKLLYRLTADIDSLETAYLRILVPAFVAASTTTLVAVALGLLNPWLGLAAGIWLIATSTTALLVAGRFAEKHGRRRAYGVEAIRSRTIDLVAGKTELVMSGQLKSQCDSISKAERYTADADDALNRLDAKLIFLLGGSSTILVAAVLMAVAVLAHWGVIGVPAAALGLIVALTATEQFAPLRRGVLELGRSLLSAQRVSPRLSSLKMESCFAEPADGHAFALAGVTAMHDGSLVSTLTDIELELDRGEIIALVGPSGSGKSSLLGLLAGELQVRSGQIRSIRPTLMTQRTELFEGTIRDNLLLANPSADNQALGEVLAAAGLKHDIDSLPTGLETPLGESGCGLSGGQSRRLALARFFLKNAQLWLLDEPTEGLDGATGRDVIRRIIGQAAGHSVVIATHLRR